MEIFKLLFKSETGKLLTLTQMTDTVCHAITKNYGITGAIIVIDNLDELIFELDNVIPIFQTNDIFTIIISRNLKIYEWPTDHIKLEELNGDDAQNLLIKCIGLTEPEFEDATQLCSLLQNFPLALQQVASFIKKEKIRSLKGKSYSVKDYFEQVERSGDFALSYPLLEIGRKIATMFIWDVTFKKMKEQDGNLGILALELLNIISFLWPDSISIEFVKIIIKTIKNSHLVDDELHLLKSYSLVNVEVHCISIHSVVQIVVQTNMKREIDNKTTTWLSFIRQLLISIDPSELSRTDISHALYIWQQATKFDELLKCYWKFADAIFNRFITLSMYAEAAQLSIANCSHFPSVPENESLASLVMQRNVGRNLEFQDEFKEAGIVYKEVLRKMMLIFENDEETLNTAHLYASILNSLNMYEEALKIGLDVLNKKIERFGNINSSTLRTKHNVALTYSRMGLYEHDNVS